jgi:hypothetical protein
VRRPERLPPVWRPRRGPSRVSVCCQSEGSRTWLRHEAPNGSGTLFPCRVSAQTNGVSSDSVIVFPRRRLQSRAMEDMTTRIFEVCIGAGLGVSAFVPGGRIGPARSRDPRRFHPVTRAERIVMLVFAVVFAIWGIFGLG